MEGLMVAGKGEAGREGGQIHRDIRNIVAGREAGRLMD